MLGTIVRILALAILWFVQAFIEYMFEQLVRGLGSKTKKIFGLKVSASGISEFVLGFVVLLIGVPLTLVALTLQFQELNLVYR